MGEVKDPNAVNRAAADYVRWLKARLRDGKQEIERQRTVLSENREHIDEMARWREETERQLQADRERLGEGTAA